MSTNFSKNIIYDSVNLLNNFILNNVKYKDLTEEDKSIILLNRDHLIISLNNPTNQYLSSEDIMTVQLTLNKVKNFIQ
jgi:hypothetical protein